MTENRIAMIRATLKDSKQEDVIRKLAPLLSRRGLFLSTRSTRSKGSAVHFEFKLADSSVTYAGMGVVREEFPYTGDDSQKVGMLIALQKINRPFKEVIDAVLGADEGQHAAPVETSESSADALHDIGEADAAGGLDFFGDMDVDAGLDSLFAGIQKKTSKYIQNPTSGIYERPAVVSGLLELPSETDFLELAQISDDVFVSDEDEAGIDFDNMPKPSAQDEEELSKASMITGQFSQSEVLARAERAQREIENRSMTDIGSQTTQELDVLTALEQAEMQAEEAERERLSAQPSTEHETFELFGESLLDMPKVEHVQEEASEFERRTQSDQPSQDVLQSIESSFSEMPSASQERVSREVVQLADLESVLSDDVQTFDKQPTDGPSESGSKAIQELLGIQTGIDIGIDDEIDALIPAADVESSQQSEAQTREKPLSPSDAFVQSVWRDSQGAVQSISRESQEAIKNIVRESHQAIEAVIRESAPNHARIAVTEEQGDTARGLFAELKEEILGSGESAQPERSENLEPSQEGSDKQTSDISLASQEFLAANPDSDNVSKRVDDISLDALATPEETPAEDRFMERINLMEGMPSRKTRKTFEEEVDDKPSKKGGFLGRIFGK